MFNSNYMFVNLLFVIVFSISLTSKAVSQSSINFEVDVRYANYQPGDAVLVTGNVPELGNWDLTKALELNTVLGKTKIVKGAVVIDSTQPETNELQYKFVVVKADGSAFWEERFNRTLSLNETEIKPGNVFFSDRAYSGLTSTLTALTITLDASDFYINGETPEGIAVFGNRGNLGFNPDENRVELKEIGNGLWSTTIMLPYGTWPDIEFKFAWLYDGKWQWEYIPGHANHVAWLDKDVSAQSIHMIYVPGTGNILPDRGQPNVDNFGLLQEQMGEVFWATNYAYNFALSQLNGGNAEQALISYNRYEANKTDDSGIDDFNYRFAAHIHKQSGIDAAIKFIEGKQKEEKLSDERKAYFEYLKGEFLLHEGERAAARTHFKTVITNYADSVMASEYSSHGLIMSYLSEPESDSVEQGLHLIRQNLFSDTTKTHQLLQYIAHAHQRLDNKVELEQSLWQMTQFGTPKQRSIATLRLGQKQARERRFEEALHTVSSIDSSKVSTRIFKNKEFLEVRLLEETGKIEKLDKLKAKLKKKYRGDARLQRFVNSRGQQ